MRAIYSVNQYAVLSRAAERDSRQSELERFAAFARSHIKEHPLEGEDCGAPIGRVRLRNLGSLSAPRLCGDSLGPCRDALPLFPPHAEMSTRKIRPGFSSPGGRELGPLRLVRSLPFVSGPFGPPPLRAPRPSSEVTDGLQLESSWTRDGCSLMQRREAGISSLSSETRRSIRRRGQGSSRGDRSYSWPSRHQLRSRLDAAGSSDGRSFPSRSASRR